MLITPQIVLTANHCIWGDPGTVCNSGPVLGAVNVGGGIVGASFNTTAYVSRWDGCVGVGSSDLAILYLAQPVTASGMKGTAPATSNATPKVVRPSFVPPTVSGLPKMSSHPLGVAGFSSVTHPVRQGLDLTPPTIEHLLNGNDFRWARQIDNWQTEVGDSGGPLFVRRPDGSRDPIGILSSKSDGWMFWADVTTLGNRQFVLDHTTEANVPVSLRHTSNWLVAHGKSAPAPGAPDPPKWWWGELDYSGPCEGANAANDQDCDGWFDHGPVIHDNCLAVANPDQSDKDDDGSGDLCDNCPYDPGPDADGDGVCASGPPDPSGSLYKADNCPLVANPDQKNCNAEAEAEGVRGHDVLGDACDPVPCPKGEGKVALHQIVPGRGLNPMVGGLAEGRFVTDRILSTRIAPHKRQPPTNVPHPVSLSDAPTDARYCQSNPDDEFNCHLPPVIDDTQLGHWASSLDEERSPTFPWHRVTLAVNALNRDHGSWNWNYDSGATLHNWDYVADNQL